jgi:hypothetical protein
MLDADGREAPLTPARLDPHWEAVRAMVRRMRRHDPPFLGVRTESGVRLQPRVTWVGASLGRRWDSDALVMQKLDRLARSMHDPPVSEYPATQSVTVWRARAPKRTGRSGLDEDLDVLLLVVDQLLEAVVDDVVERDPSGDELERIDFSARDHLDRGGMVVGVREAS